MTVGMQQLQVACCVRTTSAAPDTMVDMQVFLCDPQRLTAHGQALNTCGIDDDEAGTKLGHTAKVGDIKSRQVSD